MKVVRLGRTIPFYQVFFQQGSVALGKCYISPQNGHAPQDSRDGFFFVQCPGLIFLAARWSGPVTSASMFSVFLDYIFRVCQSLWDSFLYLGKLHWFLYLLLSYFYDPGMFIFRWSSNFVEKVVSEDDRTGCRNISQCQQQQFYLGLRLLGRWNSTYFWNDSWI